MKRVIAVILGCTIPQAGLAQRYNTINGIQYSLPQPTQAEIKRGEVSVPKELKVPPEWQPLLNRAYEEYWTEGNHRPDAGLVLFARNPTKETAKLWLLRMESKAKNLEVMMPLVLEAQKELIAQGLMKDRYNLFKTSNTQFKNLSKSDPSKIGTAELKSLDFFFVFSPECGHCRQLASVLSSFPNVHPLQATGGKIHNWDGLPPSEMATRETIRSYAPDGAVPVLLVFDQKSQKMVRMAGSKTSDEIILAASSLLASRNEK